MRRLVVLAALLLACLAPAAARADTALLPPDLGLPWTDPAHQSPLEQLLAPIASKIAGRPVQVRCSGTTDWNALAAQRNINPAAEVGWVDAQKYSPATGRFLTSAVRMELSMDVCLPLQVFAQAAVKPTRCQPEITQTTDTTVLRTVIETTTRTFTRPTRVNGRLYPRGTWQIPVKRRVATTVATSQKVLGASAPCFLGIPAPVGTSRLCWNLPTPSGTTEQDCFAVTSTFYDPAYWTAYSNHAFALWTLAHEAIHLLQFQGGAPVPGNATLEAQPDCSGMQWVYDVALALGDAPDDAQSIATFVWKVKYPFKLTLTDSHAKQYPYWSADCVPGGALDIRPDKSSSNFWP
jgi:hypothetical protein